jgi:hypothetical protein
MKSVPWANNSVQLKPPDLTIVIGIPFFLRDEKVCPTAS